jgi:FlaA1/EpsC-like NDP-sugar epimerase
MTSPGFRPIVVRFGNVLGSSGSVLQVMRECVRAGRPIPLTDPDATRFFMTDTEAVALVLRADLLADAPRIFWLDMGDPIRMADLVQRLLEAEALAGFPPVPIDIIGLRPGEKRIETLTDPALRFDRTVDRSIRVARELTDTPPAHAAIVGRVRRVVAQANDMAALTLLSTAVEGYAPSQQALVQARTLATSLRADAGRAPRRKRQAA